MAFLLPRPVTDGSSFYELADSVSDELAELAAMFCNRRGHLWTGRIVDDVDDETKQAGGFLQVYAVEVMGPGHAGKCDLGLHLVHETFAFLNQNKNDEWAIAVMVPLLLGVDVQKWPDFHNRLRIDPRAAHHTIEQTQGLQAANTKIKRHFARMGFVQAGRNAEHHHAWFLTAPMYYGKSTNEETRNGDKAGQGWKTKDEVQSLDIFVAPEKHQPQGVDEQLHALVVDEPVDLTEVRKLVKEQNASIHDSRALFVAAASNDTDLLRALVQDLGGSLHDVDEKWKHTTARGGASLVP